MYKVIQAIKEEERERITELAWGSFQPSRGGGMLAVKISQGQGLPHERRKKDWRKIICP
jgi:hypothetical protein